MKTFYSLRHSLHAPNGVLVEGFPFISEEVTERAELILQAIQAANFGPVEEPADFGLEPLLAVHDRDYLSFLQTAYAQNATLLGKEAPVLPGSVAPRSCRRKPRGFLGQVGYYGYGVGSPILAGTWEAAYWSAQCALSAASRVRQGDRAAYALCRPPGHHASWDLYGGFCYLNNVAAASRWLGGRAAILDIDYHHGNGTQEIFYEDSQILFCSLHAHPDDDYPYFWGDSGETGAGAGQGYNLNVPLPPRTTDSEYLRALDPVLERIRRHVPEHLFVSLGLDIAEGDEVGGFCISAGGFKQIGRRIGALDIPTVIVQEGGYLLEKLGENVLAFFDGFGC
jgi:acetoin utilization deacetylase AcuC-like enzyme